MTTNHQETILQLRKERKKDIRDHHLFNDNVVSTRLDDYSAEILKQISIIKKKNTSKTLRDIIVRSLTKTPINQLTASPDQAS